MINGEIRTFYHDKSLIKKSPDKSPSINREFHYCAKMHFVPKLIEKRKKSAECGKHQAVYRR